MCSLSFLVPLWIVLMLKQLLISDGSVLDLSLSITYLGYTTNDPDLSQVNITSDEISGLVWFDNNIFYAISDTGGVFNKGWIKYSYNYSNYEMTPIAGTIMKPNEFGDNSGFGIDSESIAFLLLPFSNGFYSDTTQNTATNKIVTSSNNVKNKTLFAYVVIGKEGYRKGYDQYDEIMLYDMNGTYIKYFNYPNSYYMTNDSGSQNNGGFEALDISRFDNNYINYSTIVYANERVLIQDNCDICHRITVGNFNNGLMSNLTSMSQVNLTNNYMLRYDVIDKYWQITDILLLNATKFELNTNENNNNNDYLPKMPALVLEGKRAVTPHNYSIFLVDLYLDTSNSDDNEKYNIINCFSIGNSSSDCPEISAINKLSVLTFDKIQNISNRTLNLFDNLNFESIAIMPNILDECLDRLVMVNDNGEEGNNYWLSFDINYCDNNNIILITDNNNDGNNDGNNGDSNDDDGNGKTKKNKDSNGSRFLSEMIIFLVVLGSICIAGCLYARFMTQNTHKANRRARNAAKFERIEYSVDVDGAGNQIDDDLETP